MMSEAWLICLVTISSAFVGSLMSILLGIILYELRMLRKEIRSCVSGDLCRTRMQEHENRLLGLERMIFR